MELAEAEIKLEQTRKKLVELRENYMNYKEAEAEQANLMTIIRRLEGLSTCCGAKTEGNMFDHFKYCSSCNQPN